VGTVVLAARDAGRFVEAGGAARIAVCGRAVVLIAVVVEEAVVGRRTDAEVAGRDTVRFARELGMGLGTGFDWAAICDCER